MCQYILLLDPSAFTYEEVIDFISSGKTITPRTDIVPASIATAAQLHSYTGSPQLGQDPPE